MAKFLTDEQALKLSMMLLQNDKLIKEDLEEKIRNIDISNNDVFIGDDLPEVGNEKTLYINKRERGISIWNESTHSYVPLLNVDCIIDSVPIEDIDNLFLKEDS